MLVILGIVFLFIIGAGFSYLRLTNKESKSFIPGLSKSDKQYGNLPDIQAAGSFLDFLTNLHKKFGGIASFWLGSIYCVSLSEAQYFKDTLSIFDRAVPLFEFAKPLLGPKSIQYANGSDGRRRHKLYSETFSHKVIVNQILPSFNQILTELKNQFLSLPDDKHISLYPNMMDLAVKLIARTQFGSHFKSDENLRRFQGKYEFIVAEMDEMMMGVWSEDSDKMRFNHLQKEIESFTQVIKQIMDDQRKSKESGDYYEAPFLNCLLDNCFDEEESISDVTTFFVGGFHTTGSFLTWAFYYLTLHQDVQDRVRDEIKSVLGKRNNVEAEDISKLKYTTQVMEETLRISKPGAFAARINETQDINIGGHLIPAGTPIVHAVGVASGNAKVFPDPDKFDPERFSPENVKKRSGLSFIPFGSGQRMCPGYKFSRMEVYVTICHLIKDFKFTFALDKNFEVEHKYGVTTKPSAEIWIKLKPLYKNI